MRLHANKYVEALLYITIPLAVHIALTPRLLKRVLRRTRALVVGHPDSGYVVREIAATTTFHEFGATVTPTDELNLMLQRAIAECIATTIQLETQRTDTIYQLQQKPLEEILQARVGTKHIDDDRASSTTDDGEETTDEDDDGDDSYYEKKDYSYEALRQLRVAAVPAAETWADVAPGVFFQYVVTGNDDDDDAPSDDRYSRRVTMTFRLRSKRSDASQAIDALVRSAFFAYKKRQLLKSAQDTTRYIFVQTIQEQKRPSSELGSDTKTTTTKKLVFKRYPLGDDKSFSNLFFPERPWVLHLLDNFTQRKGKFAIQGFPYKLGLLLHGPPGTGKTSLIKAVAHYTKRHIVSISLAQIRTNQELMDAVFDLRFPIEGRETPIVLDFADVVFVMEDIDCAGASVVHARRTDADVEIKEETNTGRRRRLAGTAHANDKLNLSGLLNVLDGVIDCPGRIVIMTTNHPEKLDPALVRPGRVNAQLLLGPMAAPEVIEMFEYYFDSTLSPTERRHVESAMQVITRTPAQVEEICAEYDTIEDAIIALGGAAL